jgi:COP9 signalosome complex subunit 1
LVEVAKRVNASSPLAVEDATWIATRNKQVKAEADRLEHELKGYKNNLIKESIRVCFTSCRLSSGRNMLISTSFQMGNEELGAFYYTTGLHNLAFKAYTRMREYCTTPKHILEMTLKLIMTSIAQDNWLSVSANLYKLSSLTLKPSDEATLSPVVQPLRGIANLASSDYTMAASAFLSTEASYATNPPVAGINFQRTVLSPNDIAIYGALCSLATMSRTELRTRVLENTAFRTFLELEPHLRRCIADFIGGKYTSCLKVLESYRADWTLDIYLQRHIDRLLGLVRRKMVVAYVAPFSRVSIAKLASAFSVTSDPITEEVMTVELVEMIRDGSLSSARIDAVEGVLVAREGEAGRVAVAKKALEVAGKTEKELKLRLWRTNLMEAGLELKQDKKDASGGKGMEMRSGRGKSSGGFLKRF